MNDDNAEPELRRPNDLASNPLMKLVDAATLVQAAQGITKTSESDCSSTTSSLSAASLTDVNEGKVVKGRKEELFKMNRKVSFIDELLSALENDSHRDTIAWMADGKSFCILNHKRFSTEIMPKIFNIRNMSSFVRKLTRWGFSRRYCKAMKSSDIFYHDDFQRGKPDLAKKIRCEYRLAAASSPHLSHARTMLGTSRAPKSSVVPLGGTVRRIYGSRAVTPPASYASPLNPALVLSVNPTQVLASPLNSSMLTSEMLRSTIDALRAENSKLLLQFNSGIALK